MTASVDLHPTNLYTPIPAEAMDHSVVHRFEQMVEQFPERLAFKTQTAALSYTQMNSAANRLAHALIQLRGNALEPVLLLLGHSVGIAVGLMGVLKAGKFYVPLDSAHPLARLKTVVDEVGAAVLVTDVENRQLATELAENTTLSAILVIEEVSAEGEDHNTGIDLPPDSPMYLTFTSGTSGKPKGMVRTHYAVISSALADTDEFHFSSEDRFTLLHSYSFGASRKMFYGAWLNGGGISAYDVMGDGFAGLARWLADDALTVFYATTSLFRHFASTLQGQKDLPHMRLIIITGEPMHRHDLTLFQHHFSGDALLVNSAGSTEVSVISQYFMDKHTVLDSAVVPIGYAAGGISILLLGADGSLVPDGKIGEIGVKGKSIKPGYWRNEAQNDSKFQLQADGDWVYRTGDLGRFRPDGALEHLGRKDAQIKIHGLRVEPAEVEVALLSYEGVRGAAVFPFDLPSSSADTLPNKALAAYLVMDQLPPNAELRRFLAQTLPNYMIPAVFVGLDALPLNVAGKVDQAALPRPMLQAQLNSTGSLAATPTERDLFKIVQGLLGISTVHREDSFFDLGGDSLRALRLIARINADFKINLTPADLYNQPTMADLAAHIDGGAPSPSPLVVINASGTRPAIICLAGGGNVLTFHNLARHIGHDTPIYALQHPYYVGEEKGFASISDLAAYFNNALTEIVNRHQSLWILGSSVGGMIAYEMAQQLTALGTPPTGVIMMDTHFPEESQQNAEQQNRRGLKRYINAAAGMNPLEIAGWVTRRTGEIANRLTERTLYWLDNPERVKIERVRELMRPYSRAYQPQPYNGKVLYFSCRAARRKLATANFSVYEEGWELLIREQGEFTLIDVDMLHGYELNEPNIREIVRYLRLTL